MNESVTSSDSKDWTTGVTDKGVSLTLSRFPLGPQSLRGDIVTTTGDSWIYWLSLSERFSFTTNKSFSRNVIPSVSFVTHISPSILHEFLFTSTNETVESVKVIDPSLGLES